MNSSMNTSAPPTAKADYSEGRVDPIYGQKGALPLLADDDVVFQNVSADAIRYLKGVRAEADGLPVVLVGSNSSSRDRCVNNRSAEDTVLAAENFTLGRYLDGTYFSTLVEANGSAVTSIGGSLTVRATAPEQTYVSPRSAFHLRLASLFAAQTTALALKSPMSHGSATLSDHEPVIRMDEKSTDWAYIMKNTQPVLSLLIPMNIKKALSLVGLASSILRDYTSQTCNSATHLGAWIWALLCRLGEVGVLNCDEIFVVRELGKTARSILRELRQATKVDTEHVVRCGLHTAEKQVNYSGEDLIDAESEERDQQFLWASDPAVNLMRRNSSSSAESMDRSSVAILEQTKAKLIAQYATNAIDRPEDSISAGSPYCEEDRPLCSSLFAMLDIILSVIGRAFGQHDLLEGEDALWEE